MTCIVITHVPTKKQVEFSAFLKSFNDTYKSEWNQQPVMGRMDPVATFKRTSRVISFSFTVPSENLGVAKSNQEKIRKLSTFLYPVYKQQNIAAPPQRNAVTKEGVPPNVEGKTLELYQTLKQATTLEQQLGLRQNVAIMSASPIVSIKFANFITDSKGEPLYGYLDGLKINPQTDDGYFLDSTGVFPRTYLVDLNFNVIHNEPLGWTIDNKPRGGPWSLE